MRTEAEIGEMRLQAKERQGLPGSLRSWKAELTPYFRVPASRIKLCERIHSAVFSHPGVVICDSSPGNPHLSVAPELFLTKLVTPSSAEAPSPPQRCSPFLCTSAAYF